MIAGLLVWVARRPPAEPARPDPVQALVSVLEIVPVSYEGAVQGGAVVPGQEVQYRGARDAVRRAQALLAEARPAIAARDPAAARRAEATLEEIEEAVAALRPPAAVRALTEQAIRTLQRVERDGAAVTPPSGR